METEHQRGGDFPSTHWSTVVSARQMDSTSGQAALGRFIDRYRRPLLVHLRWRFQAFDDQAEDWLHSFVEKRILKKEILRQADQNRGRFRAFLLTALDHFVLDELRHSTRISRDPEGGLMSLDELDADAKIPEATSDDDPFDHAWAQAVLAETTTRLREYYHSKGRADIWGVFQAGLLEPILGEEAAPTWDELAQRFGYVSARQASNGLITAKRMFKQILGVVIAEYAPGQGAVVEEVRELNARLVGRKT
jgi:DNA-directed RNA polymerase specialized sigma24 family protein